MASGEKGFYSNTVDPSSHTLAMTLTDTTSKAGTIKDVDTDSKHNKEKELQSGDGTTVLETQSPDNEPVPDGVLTGLRLNLVFLSLMLSVFVSRTGAFSV
jgi:hypothetical protein